MRNWLFRYGKPLNSTGQAFTLEGIMSGILVLTVAYFLFQSTLIVSPLSGDIVDAQLKQLGIDALNILSNPDSDAKDTLENSLAKLNATVTPSELINSLEKLLPDNIDFNLEVVYINSTTDQLQIYKITDKDMPPNTVTATKIIMLRNGQLVDDSPFKVPVNQTDVEGVSNANYPVVLEVRLYLWQI